MIIFTIIGIIVASIILIILLIILGAYLSDIWDKYIEPIYRWYFKNEVLVIERIEKHIDISNQFTEILSVIFSSFTPDYKYYYRKRTKDDKKIICKH